MKEDFEGLLEEAAEEAVEEQRLVVIVLATATKLKEFNYKFI